MVNGGRRLGNLLVIAREGGACGRQLTVQLDETGRELAGPAGTGAFLVEETRTGCRRDLGFEFFDFDADDFVLRFDNHCSVLPLVEETRTGLRSDLGFEFFDFDADDFVLRFVIHCFPFLSWKCAAA